MSDNDVILYSSGSNQHDIKLTDGSVSATYYQTVSITLDDVTFSLSSDLRHSQSLTLSLDSIDINILESVRHVESISITLSEILVSISAVVSSPFSRRIAEAMYVPAPVPEDIRKIPLYINEELLKIRNAIDALSLGHIDKVHAAPAKPRDGDFRLADGTNWNPGSGAGFYGYHSGAWNKLG